MYASGSGTLGFCGRLTAVRSLLQGYRVTLTVLIAVILVGVGWELLYHLLQQFRWDKDWPTLFGLVTIVNEGLLMWVLVRYTGIVLPRWRFRGGRVI